MWKVLSLFGKMEPYDTELAAYRLQDRHIPRLFGAVRLCITPEPTLHPITDVVHVLVLEYSSDDRRITGFGCSLHDYDYSAAQSPSMTTTSD